jgi:hypothetical protein
LACKSPKYNYRTPLISHYLGVAWRSTLSPAPRHPRSRVPFLTNA